MIKNIISEKDKKELEKDGYKFEYNNNILTIRNFAGKLLVEIIFFEEKDEILISTREKYDWSKNINAIVSAFGESLFIFYIGDDGEEEIIVDN